MLRRFLVVGIAMTWIAASVHGAEAKGATYILAGGELGRYAVMIGTPQGSWLPGEHDHEVEPPRQPSSLVYDMYASYGNLAVSHQLANGGPELRYYPELRLLQRSQPDSWYRLAPETAAFLDAAIEEALAKRGRGELEKGPIAADFRARHLPEVRYWLRPSTAVDESPGVPALAGCAECIGLAGPREAFIMRDLVEVLSQAPKAHGRLPEASAFLIEYEGIVEPPYGGIGGRLGHYDPPAGDAPGRFWPGGYSLDMPYYETTAGFDAVIAEALSRSEASAQIRPADERVEPRSTVADNGRPISTTTAVVGAGLAVAGVALGGGAGVLYARRRLA